MKTPTTTGELRLSKRQLFASIGYVPHDGQTLVHRSSAPRRVLCCGSRWGKTTLSSMEVVAALLAPCEESLGWIVTPSFETSELVFAAALHTLRQHFAHRIVNVTSREVDVLNLGGGRSRMRAKSGEDANSLVGAAIDWLVVDEAALLPARIWELLSPRLIDRAGWALIVSTPRQAEGWFFDLFRLGQRARDPRYKSWSSPSWTNPHVDLALIAQERKSLSREACDATYEGQFPGVQPEECLACGGPKAGAYACILLEPGEQPRKCNECNGLVDSVDGKTRVALVNGRTFSVVIGLDPRAPGALQLSA